MADDDAVRQALVEVGSGAGDMASVTRPLLDALQSMTELESTFLTSIDWDREVQRTEVVHGAGELRVPVGIEIPWAETLCRRALETGRQVNTEVAETWGDNPLAKTFGIRTYVSVPVVLADGEVYGTICGASRRSTEVDDRTRALLSVFSRIIADAVARERELAAATEGALTSARLLRERSQFVAAAQHRLKTPLTVIQGWASMLLEDDPPLGEEEREVALHAIARAASHATAEVASMLAESGTDALANHLSVTPVDVPELARRCLQDLATLSAQHRLETVVEGEPPSAATDPEALRIVLEHLVDNAVKYSPRGSTVRVEIGTSDAGRVRLAVRDDGIGLPVGVDIFAPFQRGVSHEQIAGSGLGLHVVQSLVRAVGGEVTALRNQDGPGSTVTVLLPPARRR